MIPLLQYLAQHLPIPTQACQKILNFKFVLYPFIFVLMLSSCSPGLPSNMKEPSINEFVNEESAMAENDLSVINIDGKYGFAQNGKIIVEAEYASATPIVDNISYISSSDNKWGHVVFEADSYKLFKPEYDAQYVFKDGKAIVKKDEVFGIIDLDNRFIISLGDLIVKSDTDKNSYVSFLDGETWYLELENLPPAPLPAGFSLDRVEHGYAIIRNNDADTQQEACIDTSGTYIIEPFYNKITVYNDGIIQVQLLPKNDDGTPLMMYYKHEIEKGYVNTRGELLTEISLSVDDNFHIDGGVVKRNEEGMMGAIDANFNEIIPFQYETIISPDAENAVLRAVKGGKWGTIRSTGETIIPFEYDYIQEHSLSFEALSAMKDTMWGKIDPYGNTIIPCIYPGEIFFPLSNGAKIGNTYSKDGIFYTINLDLQLWNGVTPDSTSRDEKEEFYDNAKIGRVLQYNFYNNNGTLLYESPYLFADSHNPINFFDHIVEDSFGTCKYLVVDTTHMTTAPLDINGLYTITEDKAGTRHATLLTGYLVMDAYTCIEESPANYISVEAVKNATSSE